MNNPITEEIRSIRRALAARFANDLQQIFADIQRQQRESGREYIRMPSRPPQAVLRRPDLGSALPPAAASPD